MAYLKSSLLSEYLRLSNGTLVRMFRLPILFRKVLHRSISMDESVPTSNSVTKAPEQKRSRAANHLVCPGSQSCGGARQGLNHLPYMEQAGLIRGVPDHDSADCFWMTHPQCDCDCACASHMPFRIVVDGAVSNSPTSLYK